MADNILAIPTGSSLTESPWKINGNAIVSRMEHAFPYHSITQTNSTFSGYGMLTKDNIDINETDIIEFGIKIQYTDVYAASTTGFPIMTTGPEMTAENKCIAVAYDHSHKYFTVNYKYMNAWINVNSSPYVWDNDSWLYIKMEQRGVELTLKVSTNGVEWDSILTADTDGFNYLGTYCFGGAGSNQITSLNKTGATIHDMRYCYIKINNDIVWGNELISGE